MFPAAAFAQSAVFPETTRAGKLDGAAPGSVTVSIGGRLFAGIEFQGGTGNTGPTQRSSPQFVDYVRLYPSFDYVNPAGVHFGVAMEFRTGQTFSGARQGVGSGGNTIGVFSGQGYVTSERFGKLAVGSPNSAVDQLGVGTGDDFGTGGFFGEYGWANSPIWMMADEYDGDIPKQKLAYFSPTLAGFTLGVSYQPTSVGLNNSGALIDNGAAGSGLLTAFGAQSRDRVEAALAWRHAFGPVAVKADVGCAHAGISRSAAALAADGAYRDVDLVNAGAVLNYAGFELEGSVNTGHFAYNYEDSGSPFGPSLRGARGTTAFDVGVGYAIGAYTLGVTYYGVDFDQGDYGATTVAVGAPNVGHTGLMRGVAVGGTYKVGPGVAVNFDYATNSTRTPGALQKTPGGGEGSNTHGTLFAVGAYFEW